MISASLSSQCLCRAWRRDVRDPDAHDEQRHRDGEHRVAEERDPVELELPERRR